MWNSEIFLEKIYRSSSSPYIQENKRKFSILFKNPNEAISKLETISSHLQQKPVNINAFKTELFQVKNYVSEQHKSTIVECITYLKGDLKLFDDGARANLEPRIKEFLELLERINLSEMKIEVVSDSGESVESSSSFEEVESNSSDSDKLSENADSSDE